MLADLETARNRAGADAALVRAVDHDSQGLVGNADERYALSFAYGGPRTAKPVAPGAIPSASPSGLSGKSLFEPALSKGAAPQHRC